MAITQLLLAAKAMLTDPVLADGAVSVLSLNKDGRLRVASKPGLYALFSGNMAALGDQAALDVTDAASLTFLLKNTGTVTATAGAFIFEVSPDSTNGIDGTWVPVLGARSNANAQETNIAVGTITAGSTFGWSWRVSVIGSRWFRVRCTTAVTASSIFTAIVQRESFSIEANPVIPSHAVSQSGAWTVAQGTPPWSVSQSGAWAVTATPAVGTGYSYVSTAVAVAQSVKASAASLTELSVFNGTGATVYLKLYNKASAPAPATDTPVHIIPIAAGAPFAAEYGSLGKRFGTGLAFGITGAAAITDATAIGAGVLVSATYL